MSNCTLFDFNYILSKGIGNKYYEISCAYTRRNG